MWLYDGGVGEGEVVGEGVRRNGHTDVTLLGAIDGSVYL